MSRKTFTAFIMNFVVPAFDVDAQISMLVTKRDLITVQVRVWLDAMRNDTVYYVK